MKLPSLKIRTVDYTALLEYLLQNEIEQAAFGYARVEAASPNDLVLEHFETVPPEGFVFQSDYHIEISGDVLAAAIKSAWDRGLALVEFHSHPAHYGTKRGFMPKVKFSASDLSGFEEWVPHVQWRLKHQQPYLAVVFSRNSFDALFWQAKDSVHEPRPMAGIRLDDDVFLEPSGRTLEELKSWGSTA